MDIASFLASSEAYPLPKLPDGTTIKFSYGTAGFRTVGTTLHSTVFRCGALAAIRSRVTGRACGIMITASHNPEVDNGVKLVDCTGGMLPTSWEGDAEALANAGSADEMRKVLTKLLAIDEPASSLHPPPPKGLAPRNIPHVFLARDTRPTGPALAEAAASGATAAGATVTDLGLNTTPQLHFAVYASYRGLPNTERAYYERLARGYTELLKEDKDTDAGDAGDTHSAQVELIFVDCANGVGAGKFGTYFPITTFRRLSAHTRTRRDVLPLPLPCLFTYTHYERLTLSFYRARKTRARDCVNRRNHSFVASKQFECGRVFEPPVRRGFRAEGTTTANARHVSGERQVRLHRRRRGSAGLFLHR